MGSGPPLIVLHGLLGMLDNWKSFGKLMAENHTVFLVDLRNHGRSPHHSVMTYSDMAQDILHFMDEQWLHKEASILGHSMGGKVAMQAVIDDPDRFKSLLVVDIAPKTYPASHEHILLALQSLDLAAVSDRREIEARLIQQLGERGVVSFLMKNLTRTSDGFGWKVNLDGIAKNYPALISDLNTDNLPAFEGSVTFFKGDQSDYIQSDDLPTINRLFPSAQLITVPVAGQLVHVENR